MTPKAPILGPWDPDGGAAQSALALIARTVKSAVRELSADDVRQLMIARYRTLRLMDETGQWTVPELAERADTLLPGGLDGQGLGLFVDRMVEGATENVYLMRFLTRARHTEFPQLKAKISAEGPQVFPVVLAHAAVIDRLVSAMIQDYRVNVACRAHWDEVAHGNPKFREVRGAFTRLKTYCVDQGVDRCNESHRTGTVDPRTFSFILPFNIAMAVAADVFFVITGPREARPGHLANARAGIALATHGPQDAGPTRFSEDGRLLEIQPHDVLGWDQLYATWNMSFITCVGDWPYLADILAIPAVSQITREPGTYINRRALALELQMYSSGLDTLDGRRSTMDWTDPQLRQVWGLTNLESARDYARKAEAAVR